MTDNAQAPPTFTPQGLPAALAALLLAHAACGLAYPEGPLKIVVPFPATGSPDIYGSPRITKTIKIMQTLSTPSLTDSLAEELAAVLAGAFPQTVVRERRPGSRGLEGARYVARDAPEGRTLLIAGNPTFTIIPALGPQPRFDPRRELAAVAMLADMPVALVAASDNPARSVRDVVERARFVPGQVNYASIGDGSTARLAGESLRAAAGIEIVRVNYNGSVPALNAVMTRHVEFGFVPLAAALPFIAGGRIRIIALSSAARHPALPGVPTIGESGIAGFEVSGWFGAFASARTSGSIVSLLNYEISRGFAADELQRWLLARGLMPAPATPDEFRERIVRESERAARLLKAAPPGR